MTFIGCSAASKKALAEKPREYEGHRALMWVIDREGQLLGFAQTTLKPEVEQKLEPVKGYPIELWVGGLGKSTFTDFNRSWEEATVQFSTQVPTGGSGTTLDLTSPRVQCEYPSEKSPGVFIFVAPVGTLNSEPLKPLLAQPFQGELAEFENLLIAGVGEGNIDPDTVTTVYKLMPQSARQDQWRQLMKSPDARIATTAAAALSRLGDDEAQKIFSKIVMESKGNQRVNLIMVLCQMPKSERFRNAILWLIVQREEFRTKVPGDAVVADMDRRYNLIEALKAYSLAELGANARVLSEWAEGPGRQFKRQIDELLKPPASQP